MVNIFDEAGRRHIILRPNQSESWRTNLLFIGSLTLLSAIIAGGFSIAGAWMIWPFAGLEILLLSGALYYVCWKLHFRQVLIMTERDIKIEKGYYYPKQSWQFRRSTSAFCVTQASHPWDAPRIHIVADRDTGSDRRLIPLGEFLNQADSETLIAELKSCRLPLVDDSGHGAKTF